jgi:hypothetical protein
MTKRQCVLLGKVEIGKTESRNGGAGPQDNRTTGLQDHGNLEYGPAGAAVVRAVEGASLRGIVIRVELASSGAPGGGMGSGGES